MSLSTLASNHPSVHLCHGGRRASSGKRGSVNLLLTRFFYYEFSPPMRFGWAGEGGSAARGVERVGGEVNPLTLAHLFIRYFSLMME